MSIFNQSLVPNDLWHLSNFFFNSGSILDTQPTALKSTDDAYKLTIRTVGVAEADLHVSLEGNYLAVIGESVVEGETYNASVKIFLSDKILSQTKSIDYTSHDGITIITLLKKKDAQNKIPISKKK
jgi:HSP20 family molecular chaperone IbpA